MALSALLAAGIGAAADAGSSLISNAGNKKAQERANKYNLEQWHRQNAYNDPQAQMERLKEAGLNPKLIYGTSPTSAVGNAGAVPTAKAAEYKFDNPLKHISQYANTAVQSAQSNNLHAQSAVIAQEAALKAAQTANIGTQNAKNKFDLGLAQELKNTSVDAAKQNLNLMEQRTIEAEINNQVKDATKADLIKKAYYEALNARETMKGTQLQNELRRLEANLNKIGLQKGDNLLYRILGQAIQSETANKLMDTYKKAVKKPKQ